MNHDNGEHTDTDVFLNVYIYVPGLEQSFLSKQDIISKN